MHTCIEIRETLFDFSPALMLVFIRLLEPLARRDTVNITVKIIIIKVDLLLMESVFSLVLTSVCTPDGRPAMPCVPLQTTILGLSFDSHFSNASLVLQRSPVALAVLSLFCTGPFSFLPNSSPIFSIKR